MFQRNVNDNPALAVKGDFADANVRATVIAGAGALVAAVAAIVHGTTVPRPPYVGNFAWGNQVTGQCAGKYLAETVAKIGFVHRENQAVITDWLGDSVLAVKDGIPMTLFNQGSFWADFTAGATVGQKVFARFTDGSVYAAAANASVVTVSAMTGAVVGATGVLTIASITGTLRPGAVVSGSPFAVPVAVIAQISGTVGGIGTYLTTGVANVADATGATAAESVETDFHVDSTALVDASVTASLAATGVLTVSAVASGVLDIGQHLAAVGLPHGAKIIGFIGGSGGTGTYRTNQYGLVLTGRAVVSSNGHLAKISTWS